jgi:hypothetical protein
MMNASNMNTHASATAMLNGNTSSIVDYTNKLSPKWKKQHQDDMDTTLATSPTSVFMKLSEIEIPVGILKKATVPKDMVNSETKRSRKVRFQEGNKRTEVHVQVIPIEMIKSQRFKSRLWYTSRDIASMLERDAPILSLMEMGYTDDTLLNTDSNAALLQSKYSKKEIEEITTRGLERQTKKGIKKFHAASRASVQAVLQCQYTNRAMHIYYRMESIASVYSVTTKESQNMSIRRAKCDAMYVRDHCQIQNCTMEILRQIQQNQSFNSNSKKATTTSLFSLFQRPTAGTMVGQ